jgi:hypothetical protein
MPRWVRSKERTARWNESDDAKFQKLVKKGRIDIDDITPAFIKSIRTSSPQWENCSAKNFRTNYRRVANTLWLARNLDGARARNSESFSVSSLSHRQVYNTILLTTLLANSDEDEEANNAEDSEEEENDTDTNEGEEADDDNDSEEENEAIDNTMHPKLKPAAALPPKKKSPQKEPGVENLTTALSKSKLKVATPSPAKKFSLKTDDAYMVTAYTQKSWFCRGWYSRCRATAGAWIQGGVESGWDVFDLEEVDPGLLFWE